MMDASIESMNLLPVVLHPPVDVSFNTRLWHPDLI